MKMFVPTEVPFSVILDSESQRDHQFGNSLAKAGYTVHYEELPTSIKLRSGHNASFAFLAGRGNKGGGEIQDCWIPAAVVVIFLLGQVR